jgi:hypothetical protein
MKRIRIPGLDFASALLVLAIAVLALAGGIRTSDAQGAITMGLDMETTGNTASTLGPTQRCYQVPWSGTPFDGISDRTIDVYVTGDTQAPIVYDAWVTYDKNKVHVLQTSPTDPLIKMPPPGVVDLSGYQEGQASFAAMYSSTPYNGIAGSGTLVRIGLDIGASGVVAFGFAKGAYRSEAGLHAVTTVSGQLAINTPCPAAVGGIAELPNVSDSSGPNNLALIGLAAGALAVLTGCTWYAGRRWGR